MNRDSVIGKTKSSSSNSKRKRMRNVFVNQNNRIRQIEARQRRRKQNTAGNERELKCEWKARENSLGDKEGYNSF